MESRRDTNKKLLIRMNHISYIWFRLDNEHNISQIIYIYIDKEEVVEIYVKFKMLNG